MITSCTSPVLCWIERFLISASSSILLSLTVFLVSKTLLAQYARKCPCFWFLPIFRISLFREVWLNFFRQILIDNHIPLESFCDKFFGFLFLHRKPDWAKVCRSANMILIFSELELLEQFDFLLEAVNGHIFAWRMLFYGFVSAFILCLGMLLCQLCINYLFWQLKLVFFVSELPAGFHPSKCETTFFYLLDFSHHGLNWQLSSFIRLISIIICDCVPCIEILICSTCDKVQLFLIFHVVQTPLELTAVLFPSTSESTVFCLENLLQSSDVDRLAPCIRNRVGQKCLKIYFLVTFLDIQTFVFTTSSLIHFFFRSVASQVNSAEMYQSYLKKLDELLYQESKLTPYFEMLEKKTGVKRTYYALGFIAFLLLYIVFGYGGDLICNLIGFVFPAYKSIKAIESVDKDDDTQVN